MTVHPSIEIANYFIKKSLDTGVEVTPMKLLKLTYLAHGWHLGIFGTELIDEAVCAWKYGPVIESVYHRFKEYGSSRILELHSEDGAYPFPCDKDDYVFLDEVWDAYKNFNGIELSAITHETNSPWDIVWNKQGGCSKSKAVIPNDLIRQYYMGKASSGNGN